MIHIFKKLLNILFPIECLGCGRNDILLCENCFNSIKINKADYFKNEYIDQIHVCASFHNELLQKLIHFYKYNYIQDLSEYLSQLMINYYNQIENKLENPIIIPVPLHQKKLLMRCFNQAQLIAKKFSEQFNYNLKDNLIMRIKNTKQQAQLNKREEKKICAMLFRF